MKSLGVHSGVIITGRNEERRNKGKTERTHERKNKERKKQKTDSRKKRKERLNYLISGSKKKRNQKNQPQN